MELVGTPNNTDNNCGFSIAVHVSFEPCMVDQHVTKTYLSQSSWNMSYNYDLYKIKQNYHEDCEELVNKQINVQFHASYVYLSMVCKVILHSIYKLI